MNVGGYGNELRNDVIVGSQYGFAPNTTALSPWQQLVRRASRPLYSNEFNAYTNSGSLASIYRVRQAGGGGDLGYIFGRSSELRVGYETEYVRYSLQVGENTEPTVSGREGFSEFSTTPAY